MFALSDISRFEGEKGTCKILKPVWDVITDYLVMFLAMLSLLFAGMEVTSSSFECLPAVDCPGISRSNMSSSLLSHSTNPNACKAFYGSQKTNFTERTYVLTDFSLQYSKFVNSECSKSAIPDFLSYFWIVLFIQALALIVLDNMWLKLPTTASVIEHFASLVIACYGSPCPNFESTQAVSDIPARRQSEDHHQQDGHDIEMNTISDRNSDQFNILADPATVSAVKTLYEKVQTLKENITKSSHKFFNIRRLYLGQAVLQAMLAFTFIVIDIYYIKDLKETVNCSITQHINVPHDHFVCSHGLAPAFTYGLHVYIALLVASFFTFIYIIAWTIVKLAKYKCKYDFDKEHLPQLVGKRLSNIPALPKDFHFLLHLLHSYNTSYVVRLRPFLSKETEKTIKEIYLMEKYPVSKLQRQLEENGNKLTLTKLHGIPQTIFELATEIVALELIECKLEDEDFENFCKLTSLRELSIVKCSLDSVPEGVLKIERLEELNLKGNCIESIDQNMSRLNNITKLDLSDNGLKTINPDSFEQLDRLFELNLLGNPELDLSALKVVLACTSLGSLHSPQHFLEKVNEVNQLEQIKFSRAVKFAMEETSVILYTGPDNVPHIDLNNDERVYKMDSNPIKGPAIIFNGYSFKSKEFPTRCGSDKDVSKLKSLFENIGFETRCYIDYEAKDAITALKECAEDTNYEKCDCIVVIVMSHGTENGICFHDGKVMVPIMDLVDCVQKSSLYEGKPKLFFFQACRGNKRLVNARNFYDADTTIVQSFGTGTVPSVPLESDAVHLVSTSYDINTQSDSLPVPTHMVGAEIPKEADILLSYSTLEGHASYRHAEYGSWYVQALVEIFSKHAWEEDILSLLTLVNYKVVRAYTARGWRQVPAPQSTLRKKLYLLPGYPPHPQPPQQNA